MLETKNIRIVDLETELTKVTHVLSKEHSEIFNNLHAEYSEMFRIKNDNSIDM